MPWRAARRLTGEGEERRHLPEEDAEGTGVSAEGLDESAGSFFLRPRRRRRRARARFLAAAISSSLADIVGVFVRQCVCVLVSCIVCAWPKENST